MELGLKGKKALVMGASQGIGKAVAESLIKEGVRVIINSRTEEKLSKTCEEIGAEGYISGDLTLSGEGKRITEEAISKLGGIDILVSNTGGPAKGLFSEVSTEQWQTDFQSLWMSVVESWNSALPEMKKQNYGRLILVTSIAAKEPLSGLTTSNGLRAGLNGLAKSVSDEYAKYGITANLLLPGYTATDRLKNLNLSEDKIKEMVPAGRLGEPRELANLATFLSGETGSYITGQSFAVDGGVLRGH
ncbi:MAG: SDR family oxidoreductase [Bacteriovoracaceae bacterium]|nr:SDR family oxidoreductase [Bacteriovoracaceae bacterium]